MAALTETISLERTDTVRVLLVEDSIDHQMLTRRALERAGIEVRVAESGEVAVDVLAEADARIDLVLIDHGLPVMSGMELLDHVVELPDAPGGIMVTASADRRLVLDAMRAGAIDFVTKESGYLDLLPAVVERAHRQLDLRRRTRELQRLALVVHRSHELEQTAREVAAGAARLLRATTAALVVEAPADGQRWQVAAVVGDETAVEERELRRLAAQQRDVAEDGMLAVPLPAEAGERTGLLVVLRTADRPWLAEERELAETFAAYGASGLRQARRAELEGGLIRELQQTIRARQDFVASVSHELRTPLTSIGGYAETVLTHAEQLGHDRSMDLVGRIRRHAGDLERLVDQLIDAANLERGVRTVPDLRALSVDDVIIEAMSGMNTLLDGRDVVLDVQALQVLADVELIHRVLANLASNAVKYSPPGASLAVIVRDRDDAVEIAVRDHGIGVEESEAKHVFEPFWRAAHAVGQAVRGTGIGLALVREYVTSMGGTVGLRHPEDGGGTEFWFTLPKP